MRCELALCAALTVLGAGAARADETRARAALSAALVRAQSEACAAPRLAFTETVAEKGVVVAARFDPSGDAALWKPIGVLPVAGQAEKTYRGILQDTPDERDLLLNRLSSSLGDAGQLVSEVQNIATFDFTLSPRARPTHSPLDNALGLSRRVRVALSVDESDGRLTAVRFYAPAAFAATPLAQVSTLTLSFALGPSYFGGPTVVRKIETDAAYRVVGVAGATRDTVWFSDVAPAPAAPKRAMAC